MTPEQELAFMAEQVQRLQFPQFNLQTAWELGTLLKAKAEKRQVPISIEIRMCGKTAFMYSMPGTIPTNADWARRKSNLVELTHKSSYAVACMPLQDDLTLIQRMGLDVRDYAAAGGAFPIMVRGVGCVGVVAISGLPSRDDHIFIVDVIAGFLGVPVETVRFP